VEFEIKGGERAHVSPALQLIHEGTNELSQEGWLFTRNGLYPVDAMDIVLCAVCKPDKDIVGVLCFADDDKKASEARMTLAYVEPSSRRQGVFTALWGEFLVRAKALGFSTVAIDVHANNSAAHTLMKKLSIDPVSATYRKRLP
jgi:GNAT superfamily N-acetyltransferase